MTLKLQRSITMGVIVLITFALSACGKSSSPSPVAPTPTSTHRLGTGGGGPTDIVNLKCAPQPCASQSGLTIAVRQERSYKNFDLQNLQPLGEFWVRITHITIGNQMPGVTDFSQNNFGSG